MAEVEFAGRVYTIDDLVIAGWTGRDVAALEHHIEELKAIGVQPPSKVPLYYRVASNLLTQAEASRSWARHVRRGRAGALGTPTDCGSRSRDPPTASSRPTRCQSQQVCAKVIGRSPGASRRSSRMGPADPCAASSRKAAEGPLPGRPFGTIRTPRDLIAGWHNGDKRLPAASRCSAARCRRSAASGPHSRFDMEIEDPCGPQAVALLHRAGVPTIS